MDNDGEVMVKSSIRLKNAGESLMEILKSLSSSMYILYIPLGWKMELDKIWAGDNCDNLNLFTIANNYLREKMNE